jgi:hypothetical protein
MKTGRCVRCGVVSTMRVRRVLPWWLAWAWAWRRWAWACPAHVGSVMGELTALDGPGV